MDQRQILELIWQKGVEAVNGFTCVRNAISKHSDFEPTHIIAVGKAASPMARSALESYGSDILSLVVTKHDHGEAELHKYENLNLIESAHPVPNEHSLRAGEALIQFIDGMSSDAKLLMLVSGGASALAEALPDNMSLSDLQKFNNGLLSDGLDIHEMNRQRKEISKLKAGKLLARFKGKQAQVFAISDVEGDDISVIGSGIGEIAKSAKCKNMISEIIASNEIARHVCEQEAKQLGFEIVANEETLFGDVFEIAKEHAQKIKAGPKGIYIFGGEPVIELPKKPGEGGRNQAMATALAKEISGHKNISILVAGTDGTDGPTNSAGGFVDGTSWKKTTKGAEYLKRADSGNWLRKSGGLFVTGPTGTNVMDIMLAIKS